MLLVAHYAYRDYRNVAGDFDPQPASAAVQHPQTAGVAGLEEISFRSAEGIRLAGWYVPARNRAAIVLTHGTNADRATMLPELRILAEAGFGVLALDWPGDGRSEGTPHWNASERYALVAALDWLAQRNDVDRDKLGGLGFSMGGYVMAQVAAQDSRLRAVVLAAAPTDYVEHAHWLNRRWGILSEALTNWAIRRWGMANVELRPVDVVSGISPRPLLVLGGDKDQIVPVAMTRKLFAAARNPKLLWIVPGAVHGGYAQTAPVEYRARLVEFFTRNLAVE
jgi:dipeptidyl aminopeptidase/acylaminoacyl peptidase